MKVHIGKNRLYMGWRVEDVWERGPSGMKRSGWRARKQNVVMYAETLAAIKDCVRQEERQRFWTNLMT